MGIYVDGGSASPVDATAIGGLTVVFPTPVTPAEDGYVVTYVDATGDLELQPTAGVIVISADDPQPLGVAAPGTTGEVSDAGHVHALPTAAEVGADPAGTAAAAVAALGLGAVTATGATQADARAAISVYSAAETDAAITSTVGGLLYKGACRAVATSDVANLSGYPTIDGVTILALDDNKRVLLTAQGVASQNGPWITDAGAWSRPSPNELQACAAFPIEEGIVYHDTIWYLTSNDPIIPNVSNLAFAQLALNIPATQIIDSTVAGRALLTDANASAQRTSLGLGGAAVLNVGTTAGTVAAGDAPAAAAAAVTTTSIGAVPTSRTVNAKTLSSNITLSAADVGADPAGTAAAAVAALGLGAVTATGATAAAALAAVGGLSATAVIFTLPIATGRVSALSTATPVGGLTVTPSSLALSGRKTVLTLAVCAAAASVSGAPITCTVTLRNLTDSTTDATITFTSANDAAQVEKTASVPLPASAKTYELRVVVSGGNGISDALSIASAVLRITYT